MPGVHKSINLTREHAHFLEVDSMSYTAQSWLQNPWRAGYLGGNSKVIFDK